MVFVVVMSLIAIFEFLYAARYAYFALYLAPKKIVQYETNTEGRGRENPAYWRTRQEEILDRGYIRKALFIGLASVLMALLQYSVIVH